MSHIFLFDNEQLGLSSLFSPVLSFIFLTSVWYFVKYTVPRQLLSYKLLKKCLMPALNKIHIIFTMPFHCPCRSKVNHARWYIHVRKIKPWNCGYTEEGRIFREKIRVLQQLKLEKKMMKGGKIEVLHKLKFEKNYERWKDRRITATEIIKKNNERWKDRGITSI